VFFDHSQERFRVPFRVIDRIMRVWRFPQVLEVLESVANQALI
jgi:hypothetical protein